MPTKKTILLVILIVLFHKANSQRKSKFLNNLSIEFGVNWVDNSGNEDPLTIFKDYSDIAFNLPIKIELDYFVSDSFELYLAGTTNKFLENQRTDNRYLNRSYRYLSVDLGAKYTIFEIDVFTRSVFGFAHAGAGVFRVESLGASANIGLGGVIELSENIDFVISSVAKFAIENEYINSNHFQYSIGLKYRFSARGNNCYCPY